MNYDMLMSLYTEYCRMEANIAFIEELGRKYCGEVY